MQTGLTAKQEHLARLVALNVRLEIIARMENHARSVPVGHMHLVQEMRFVLTVPLAASFQEGCLCHVFCALKVSRLCCVLT